MRDSSVEDASGSESGGIGVPSVERVLGSVKNPLGLLKVG